MITVALVDDHAILRDPLAKLIDQFGDYKVTCQAGNGKELLDYIALEGKAPDMVVLDLNMPVMDGYETALWLRDHHPHTIIMILTAHDSEMTMIRLLKVGVKGFMQKDIMPAELQRALAEVREKGFYYWGDSRRVANLIRGGVTNTSESSLISLNEKEITLIKLSCSEMTYKAIADTMKISPRTIDSMRETLFEKLSVKSRVGIVMYAVRNGLVRL